MADKQPRLLIDVDLLAGFDLTKLDRVGMPIKSPEVHDAGKPDDGYVEPSKASHTLTDMSQDVEFFMPGLISIAGHFDRDPVVEFNRQYPTQVNEELPFAIDYAAPFFAGMGISLLAGRPINWDRRLYGIRRDRWEICRNAIAGIAIMEQRSGFYARVAFYELQIPDLPAIKKMAVIDHIPTVTCTVFAVSSNKAFSYLKPAEFPQLPTLVTEPPRLDAKIEGADVLGPPPSPERLLPGN